MKKFLLTVLTLALCWGGAGPLTAQDKKEPAAANSADSLAPPMFSLETKADDSPDMARKKAALRLFKSYSVTVGLLKGCQANGSAEAPKALAGFNSRNGNSLGTIMAAIKRLGGVNPDIKTALDTAVAAEVTAGAPDCPAFLKAVEDGARDVYKAPEYADDYALVRGQQK